MGRSKHSGPDAQPVIPGGGSTTAYGATDKRTTYSPSPKPKPKPKKLQESKNVPGGGYTAEKGKYGPQTSLQKAKAKRTMAAKKRAAGKYKGQHEKKK